jgi:hypothetical protein
MRNEKTRTSKTKPLVVDQGKFDGEVARLRKRRERIEKRLLVEAGKYLEEIGWRALVANVQCVETVLGGPEHSYNLVIRFTGGKRA